MTLFLKPFISAFAATIVTLMIGIFMFLLSNAGDSLMLVFLFGALITVIFRIAKFLIYSMHSRMDPLASIRSFQFLKCFIGFACLFVIVESIITSFEALVIFLTTNMIGPSAAAILSVFVLSGFKELKFWLTQNE